MKKKTLFLMVCQMALFILAMFAGGGMVMADAAVPAPGTDTADPNAGAPGAGGTTDIPGKGIDHQGHAASASAARDFGLVRDKVNDYVTKFRAYKYPLHTDFLTLAKQINVTTKEPTNYEIGEAVMDCTTKTGYTGTTTVGSVTTPAYETEINLDSLLYANDKKLFGKWATILVQGVDGYNEDGTAVDGSPLMLYVKSKGDHIVVTAVNGPVHNSERYVPAIPAGTLLQVMAPALSESAVEVTPDSGYPAPVKHYLQKKACAMTWTELFERIEKEADWNVQDIKDWQLAMFRKKCTRTLLISAPSRFMVENEKTGTEYAYTQRGILRQIRLGYQIEGAYKFADLVGVAKMLFGKYATSNEMDCYVGSDAMESITNMDFSEHPEITIEQELTDIGVGMTKFKVSGFGTLRFKLEYALDDIGLSKYFIAFAMKESKRLYYTKGKTININHEKGEGGEVREAKSQYYIQDDCLVLQAFNSILVGPNIAAAGYRNIGKTVATHTSGSTLPSGSTLVKGNVYYFEKDVTVTSGSTTVTYPKGLWEYNGSYFKPYEGVING